VADGPDSELAPRPRAVVSEKRPGLTAQIRLCEQGLADPSVAGWGQLRSILRSLSRFFAKRLDKKARMCYNETHSTLSRPHRSNQHRRNQRSRFIDHLVAASRSRLCHHNVHLLVQQNAGQQLAGAGVADPQLAFTRYQPWDGQAAALGPLGATRTICFN
jgi:hypothetical protein